MNNPTDTQLRGLANTIMSQSINELRAKADASYREYERLHAVYMDCPMHNLEEYRKVRQDLATARETYLADLKAWEKGDIEEAKARRELVQKTLCDKPKELTMAEYVDSLRNQRGALLTALRPLIGMHDDAWFICGEEDQSTCDYNLSQARAAISFCEKAQVIK